MYAVYLDDPLYTNSQWQVVLGGLHVTFLLVCYVNCVSVWNAITQPPLTRSQFLQKTHNIEQDMHRKTR